MGDMLMPRVETTIKTRDGNCPASIFTPANGLGPWPGVIFFMDGFGIRPTMGEMSQRLADGGYLVLLPDLYYRLGSYPAMVPSEMVRKPNFREELMKFVSSLDRDKKVSDAGAFLDLLSSRDDVKGERFGATGYCMGGNFSLTAAGAFPERFAAVASFHGGNLASDKPDSPHLFVKKITGRVYVAGAIEDGSFPEEQKSRLEKALTDAGVQHAVETYPAQHGFAVPDLPVFDAAAAERHWAALFGLFREAFAKEG
jgi:carboxymethylenebutenolidase